GFCCWVLAGGCCCCGSACAAPVPIRATPDNQSSGKDKPKRERIRLFFRANCKKNMHTPRNTLCQYRCTASRLGYFARLYTPSLAKDENITRRLVKRWLGQL